MRTVCLLTVILLHGSLGLAAGVDQWTVIGKIGNWNKSTTKASIELGMRLQPGDIIETSPIGAETGSLTILAGDVQKTYACDDPDSLPYKSNSGCAHPIAIPSDTPEPEGAMAGIFRKVSQLISKDSPRYYTAASRDTGSLKDSVVEIADHAVDLQPSLSGLSKGDYRLTIQKPNSATLSNASENKSKSISLKWDPESKQAPGGLDLSPGLYQISALSSDGDVAGDAWILVVTSENYAAKSAAFRKIRKQTESWDQNVPAVTVRAVMRASLDELSR